MNYQHTYMFEERFFRKPLKTNGFISIRGHDFSVKIKNLSVTGLLAELDRGGSIKSAQNLYKSIAASTHVDVYLPELQLGGTAKMIWSKRIDDRINFAVEFRTMVRMTHNPIYARRIHRKNVALPGQINVNGEEYAFHTENVSFAGLMIRVEEKVDITPGMVISYAFWWLDMSGEAQVVWGEYNDQATLFGLKCLTDNLNLELGDKKKSVLPLIEQDLLYF